MLINDFLKYISPKNKQFKLKQTEPFETRR